MEQDKIVLLIRKYHDNSITTDEMLLLEKWLALDPENTTLLTQMNDGSWLRTQLEVYDNLASTDRDREARMIAQKISGRPSAKIKPIWPRYAVASILFMVFSISLYLSFYKFSASSGTDTSGIVEAKDMPQPGGNRATLILEGGETIALSEAHSGLIITDSLAYEDGSLIAAVPTSFATLRTPIGGNYSVILPDGTKVKLNASSSLRYPTRFDGGIRKVILTGEAFFEVAHNLKQPFVVETETQSVKVLGTVFNINAYTDEQQVATTLIEGKVAVTRALSDAEPVILAPGQQSLLDSRGMKVVVVDAADAVAWRDGKFIFSNSDIYTVMRQMARWYDVEVEYIDNVSAVTFSGSLSRSAPITAILEDLELTQSIKFNIEGRRIVVRRK